MSRYSDVVRLERSHVRESFDSGAPELDDWLKKYAWQNQRANNATTYLVTNEDAAVVAYYAITVAGVGKDEVPSAVAKGSPQQMGCLLLARLAVDSRHQGRGLGRALVADCLRRAVEISQGVGMKFVLIHCRDEPAKAFYLSQAEFDESPTDPMHLLVTLGELTSPR